MKWTNTDYTAGQGDKNDCSVRAYMVAACVSYENAYRLFTKHGRGLGKRTRFNTTNAVIRETFPQASYFQPHISLKRFVTHHPKGHYILHNKHHAFALCDGVIHDWNKHPRYKIQVAWKLV